MTFQNFPLDNAGTGGAQEPAGWPFHRYAGAYRGFWYDDEPDIGTVLLQVNGPVCYGIYDRDANIVSFGVVADASLGPTPAGGWPTVNQFGSPFTPDPPAGGWVCGHYTMLLIGDDSGTRYGTSRGTFGFDVIPAEMRTNFPTRPEISGWSGDNQLPDGGTGTSTQLNVGVGVELIARACLGMPMSRLNIQNTTTGVTDVSDGLATTLLGAATAKTWWIDAKPDPVRTRYLWMQFTSQPTTPFCDRLEIKNGSGAHWAWVYAKDGTIDASKVYVRFENGTGTGGSNRCKVYYPDASTLVENIDGIVNPLNLFTLVNGVSDYIWCWGDGNSGDSNVATSSPAQIGNTVFTQVKTCVQQLYAAGVTRFEGPMNEPADTSGAHTAKQYQLFKAAVVAGGQAAGAPAGAVKAMGPCILGIAENLATWGGFFDQLAALGETLDVLSFHSYNVCVNSEFNQGRNVIDAFLALVATKGYAGVEMWNTEANSTPATVLAGVKHERRADRTSMAQIMLWEQYGMPAEQQPWWYDPNHGFWPVPTFIWVGSWPSNGVAQHYAILNNETFGKRFHHQIDFGSVPANEIFCGSVYGEVTLGSVAWMISCGHIPGSKVTLNVAGTSGPLTVVTGRGTRSTVTPTNGRVTVDVPDNGVFVRLPPGVTVTVHEVGTGSGNWGTSPPPSVSAGFATAKLGGSSKPAIADGSLMTVYGSVANTTGVTYSSSGLPDQPEITFTGNVTCSRLKVHSAPYLDSNPGLLAYSVQTYDGSSWTTRNIIDPETGFSVSSIDRTSRTFSILFGDDNLGDGCQRRTWDKEQFVEIIDFATPQTAKGFRVVVTAASYGGEPDLAAMTDGTLQISAHGMNPPKLAIQEFSVYSDTTVAAPDGLDAPANTRQPFLEYGTNFGVGQQFQAVKGTWDNNPTSYSYQWQKSTTGTGSWVNVSGASGSNFVRTLNESGYYLSVNVTATNLAGSTTVRSTVAGPTGSLPNAPGQLVCRSFSR